MVVWQLSIALGVVVIPGNPLRNAHIMAMLMVDTVVALVSVRTSIPSSL
jgi:hypothetical protein